MPKLVGTGTPAEIEISRDGIVVGRDHSCDVVIRSQNVSREHARCFLGNMVIYVEDMRSRNGTTINGVVCTGPCEVRPGDEVVFGDAVFRVSSEPVGTSAPTKPPLFEGDTELGLQTVPLATPAAARPAAKPPAQPFTQAAYFKTIVCGFALLLLGLGLGRTARALGRLEMADDPAAKGEAEPEYEDLLLDAPTPAVIVPAPTVTAPETVTGEPAPSQSATPSRVGSQAIGDEGASDTAIGDSAKTIRLMREVQRAGVDLQDIDAIRGIARDKLKLSPAETERVMKTFAGLAQRNALLEGKKLPDTINLQPAVTPPARKPVPKAAPKLPPQVAPPAESSRVTTSMVTRVKKMPFKPRPRGPGYYVNLWGLALVFGVLLLWRYGIDWVDRDSRASGLDARRILQIACISGPVGTLLALAVSDLGVGMVLQTYGCSGPLLAYFAIRQARVKRVPRPDAEQEGLSNLAALGLNRNQQGDLRDLLQPTRGLLLVCGPAGSGKSTTLHAVVGELDHVALDIVTIEDPIAFRIPGVRQIELRGKHRGDYAGALRSVLRDPPHVVLLGKLPDSRTVNAACQAARSKCLLLSAYDAPDAVTALQLLLEGGTEAPLLADGFSGIVAQRLVRHLCPDCKVAYQPDAGLLRRFRIPLDRAATFYRSPEAGGVPCPTCDGTGYHGRLGIFEVLPINDKIRELIRERASPQEIRSAARHAGMTTLRENGLRLVMRGGTSLDEIGQVLREDAR